VAAAWAVTMLSLYVRVQVNVLGRHLYLDIARTAEEQVKSSVSLISGENTTNNSFFSLSLEYMKKSCM
jgi:hypothetical protein